MNLSLFVCFCCPSHVRVLMMSFFFYIRICSKKYCMTFNLSIRRQQKGHFVKAFPLPYCNRLCCCCAFRTRFLSTYQLARSNIFILFASFVQKNQNIPAFSYIFLFVLKQAGSLSLSLSFISFVRVAPITTSNFSWE